MYVYIYILIWCKFINSISDDSFRDVLPPAHYKSNNALHIKITNISCPCCRTHSVIQLFNIVK